MALFKPFRGSRASLDAQPLHDGYAYFCTDDGSFHIDFKDADGKLQRKQLNAQEAEKLIGYNISTNLNSSDIEIPTSKAVFDALATKVSFIEDQELTEEQKVQARTNIGVERSVPLILNLANYGIDYASLLLDGGGEVIYEDVGSFWEDVSKVKPGQALLLTSSFTGISVVPSPATLYFTADDSGVFCITSSLAFYFNDKILTASSNIMRSVSGTKLSMVVMDTDSVLYTEQTLTDEQKAQARANIGAEATQMVNLSDYGISMLPAMMNAMNGQTFTEVDCSAFISAATRILEQNKVPVFYEPDMYVYGFATAIGLNEQLTASIVGDIGGLFLKADVIFLNDGIHLFLSELGQENTAVLYTEQTLTDEQKAQARANIGAAEINHVEAKLQDVLYRKLTGVFIYNRHIENGTCYCVETLPEIGEAVTTDMKNLTAYYNMQDGVVYGYVDDALGSYANVPAGWYTFEVLSSIAGRTWSGVITDINDDPCDNTNRLLLQYNVLYLDENTWETLDIVGKKGSNEGAEFFNAFTNVATGEYSHAEGYGTTAEGDYSHAEGNHTNATGFGSHAEGRSTNASGNSSHTEGANTHAEGLCSHAEGYESHASEAYSHAEGSYTTASGFGSHAEGSSTTASGTVSHAEGSNTTASGYISHAEGSYTTASGDYSHAEGLNTVAQWKSQHVQGAYNILDVESSPSKRGKYAHIVGNGTSEDARSNAHTLDWNGVGWFAGGLKVGGTGQDDVNAKEVALKEYVDEQINTAKTYTDNAIVSLMLSDDEFLSWINDEKIIEPMASASGKIYTNNNNKIYIL